MTKNFQQPQEIAGSFQNMNFKTQETVKKWKNFAPKYLPDIAKMSKIIYYKNSNLCYLHCIIETYVRKGGCMSGITRINAVTGYGQIASGKQINRAAD
ncbi:hypothetical protein, partial [Parabacteroides goldsteinii]|uniref:hypothetical protein n=1 Tax=Parabacteroides goldsteinii TaxID=328812 RepID=UPI0026DFE5E8